MTGRGEISKSTMTPKQSDAITPFTVSKTDQKDCKEKQSDFELLEVSIKEVDNYARLVLSNLSETYNKIIGVDAPLEAPESKDRPKPENRIVAVNMNIHDIRHTLGRISVLRNKIHDLFG